MCVCLCVVFLGGYAMPYVLSFTEIVPCLSSKSLFCLFVVVE